MANLLSRFESHQKSLEHPGEENLLLWKSVHLQECPLGCHFDWCKDTSSDEIERRLQWTDEIHDVFNGPKTFFSNQKNCNYMKY